jgi:hypothetical protein
MLVLMALTTTVMASPVLMRLMRGTELEPFIRRSGFTRRREATAPVAASPGPVVLLEEPA